MRATRYWLSVSLRDCCRESPVSLFRIFALPYATEVKDKIHK